MAWFACCCLSRKSYSDDEDSEYYKNKESMGQNHENNNRKDKLSGNAAISYITSGPLTSELSKDPIDNTIQELKAKLDNRNIVDSGIEVEVDNQEDDAMIPEAQRGVPHPPPPPLLNQDGLIIPRKLHNPVLHNGERQNLHREMLFNQKMGKNVLNQKSELAKAMEKHKDNIMRKEYEHKLASNTPELVKVIQDRAKRMEEIQTPTQNENDKGLNNVFLQARAKLRTPSDLK